MPQVDCKPDRMDMGSEREAKVVVFDVGDSRRSSNSVFVPDESYSSDDNESQPDLLDLDTSRIPR